MAPLVLGTVLRAMPTKINNLEREDAEDTLYLYHKWYRLLMTEGRMYTILAIV